MIATLRDSRDDFSGNPITLLEVDGKVFTFPGTGRTERADALLVQLGYRAMWSDWKYVGCGGPGHPTCGRYLRMRVVPAAGFHPAN